MSGCCPKLFKRKKKHTFNPDLDVKIEINEPPKITHTVRKYQIVSQKFNFSEKFENSEFHFFELKNNIFDNFQCQVYLDNLNFCAKNRDFV